MKKELSVVKKICYALLTALIVLFLLETGSRVILKKAGHSYLSYMPLSFKRGKDGAGGRVGGGKGGINPLLPDVMNFLPKNSKVAVRFNKDGLRGKDMPYEKEGNELRILALGNSCVFGYGVPEELVFSSELEKMLRLRYTQRKITVINGGMPGFSSVNSLHLLGVAGMKYNPDIIVAYILNNDKVLEEREDMPLLKHRLMGLNWALAKSGFYNLIRIAVSGLKPGPAPEDKRRKILRPKVSPEDYERNLTRLSDISRQAGIRLYYVIPVTPDDLIRDPAEFEKFIYDNAEGERIKAILDKKRELIEETVRMELKKSKELKGPAGPAFEKTVVEITEKKLAGSGAEALERKRNMSAYKRYNFYTQKYRWIMKRVAASENAALIDLPALINKEPGIRPLEFFLDEIHPSAYGHRIIAELLYKRISGDIRGR